MTSPTPTTTSDPTGTRAPSFSETCVTAVPDKYGYVDPGACNAYYFYYPSFAGSLAFAVLMGVSTLVHILQAVIYKKRYCWVLIMGGIWETFAFAIKTAGTRDQQQLAYVVVGTLFLLLAPLWINAFIYMTIARLVYYTIPDQKVLGIRAIVLTRLFVWLDIASFLVQGTGGSLLSNDENQNLQRIGQHVYTGGIAFQALLIIVFGAGTLHFYKRLGTEGRVDRPIKRTKILICVLCANFILILMRIIFRMVEFIPGANLDNPILTNENYIFGLDAFPMLLGLVLLNAYHPGLVLRGAESEFPRTSRKEKKALKAEKKEAKKQEKEVKKAERKERRMARKERGRGWGEEGGEELGSMEDVSGRNQEMWRRE